MTEGKNPYPTFEEKARAKDRTPLPSEPRKKPSASTVASHACKQCDKTFHARGNLLQHRRYVHGIKCNWPGCGKVFFRDVGPVARHLLEHNIKMEQELGRKGCHWPGCTDPKHQRGSIVKKLQDHNDEE
ncbi:hypothetical protein F4818DRAFT_443630 [Hypoxylon cercidicola]|nr:hypothetical protein F4818DRAFT_443630 [Hypoxylon cercidicola]